MRTKAVIALANAFLLTGFLTNEASAGGGIDGVTNPIGQAKQYVGLGVLVDVSCRSNLVEGVGIDISFTNSTGRDIELPRIWSLDLWNRGILTRWVWWQGDKTNVIGEIAGSRTWPDRTVPEFHIPSNVRLSATAKQVLRRVVAHGSQRVMAVTIRPDEIPFEGECCLKIETILPLTDWVPGDQWVEERDKEVVILESRSVRLDAKRMNCCQQMSNSATRPSESARP